MTIYNTSCHKQSKKIELSNSVIELDLWSKSWLWNLCFTYHQSDQKKEDKIISCKNCEINAQLLSSLDLFNLILEKDAGIQNLYLFAYVTFEKHAKDSSKIMSSLVILMKKFAVIIDKLLDSNFLWKVIIMIVEMWA